MTGDPKPTQEFDYVLPKIVLGESGSPPTRADVQKMFVTSKANRERTIEWSWKAGSKTYALVVVYPFVRDSNWWDYERKDDPVWKILEVGAHGNPVKWEYKSGDVTLAAEMVGMIDAEAAGGSASARDAIELTATLAFDDWITRNYQELTVGIGQAAPQLVYGYLHNLQNAYFTGKVVLNNRGERAEVFFEGGVPVHAVTGDLVGDGAVEEMISWQVATFESFPNQKAEFRTIAAPLPMLVNKGLSLLEQKRYLAALGLTFESTLARVASDAAQVGRTQLGGLTKSIYECVERETALIDVVRELQVEDRDWVPALLYLMQGGLVEIKPPGAARSRYNPSAIDIDEKVRALFSAQTGMYSYRALLLFLQREYHRYQLLDAPVSLIVLDLKLGTSKAQKAAWLPPNTVKILSRKIDWLKRPIDTFAHFETLDYALLLPNTNLKQATALAKRLIKVLARNSLSADTHGGLTVVCGVASLPANGATLENLILGAKGAKDHAKATHVALSVAGQFETQAQEANPAPQEEIHVVTHAVTTNIDASRLTYTDLLFRAGQLTPDQLKEASDLVNHMPVPLPLGRVLAMEGHIEERTVDAAIEVEAMIKSGALTLEQAMKALSLVGNHDFDLQTALRRLGGGSQGSDSTECRHAIGRMLIDVGVVRDWQVSEAAKQSSGCGLPLLTLMVARAMLSRYNQLTALRLQRLVRDKVITKENAVNAWKVARARGIAVSQALRDVGCAKGAEVWRAPDRNVPLPATPESAFADKLPPPPFRSSRCDWVVAELLVCARAISITDYLTACEIDVLENKDVGAVLVECGLVSGSLISLGREIFVELDSGRISFERAVRLMARAKSTSTAGDGEGAAAAARLAELMRQSSGGVKAAAAQSGAVGGAGGAGGVSGSAGGAGGSASAGGAVAGASPAAAQMGAVDVLTAAGLVTERQLRAAKALSMAKQLPVEATILSSGVVDKRLIYLSMEARKYLINGELDIAQVSAVLRYCREHTSCTFAGGVAVFGFDAQLRD